MISLLAEPTESFSDKRVELRGAQSISSTEGETYLQRVRLIYKEENSSTDGETQLIRGRLIYGGGELSTEERLVYG
jgi:hypothetical protein